LNKQELISGISINGEMTKKDATIALEAVLEVITEALSRNEKVQLIDFGTFSVKERAERTGRNPQNGDVIQIPACSVPHFKAGKGLKNLVK
jgi:DNA-binding protein HU-beta